MPPPRPKRSLEDLNATLKHLDHEVWMVKRTAEFLFGNKANPANETSAVIHNALLESSLIHARNLVDFLYPENSRDNDVVAYDFFGDSSAAYRKNREPQTKLLKMVPRRVNKEVAHLTYDRLGKAPEQKAWPAMKIAVEIDARVDDFKWMLPARFAKTPTPEFTSTDQQPGPVTDVASEERSSG